jgi:hypothetical protein
MTEFDQSRLPAYWGMAGVFPGELELWRGDQWVNQHRFVAEQGFSGGGISVGDLSDDARRAVLQGLAASHGQSYCVHLVLDYRDPIEATRIRLAGELAALLRYRAEVPLAFLAIIVTGGSHRFDREVPLEH